MAFGLDDYIIGTAATSLIGSFFGRKDSKKAKREEDKFLDEKEAIDKIAKQQGIDRLHASRAEKIRNIDLQKRNSRSSALFQDKLNKQKYDYSLKIRDHQIRQNERKYEKSEKLYGQAIDLNAREAASAKRSQMRELSETVKEKSFANENRIIESLIARGEARVKSGNANSNKIGQAQLYALGQNMAVDAESLFSAKINTGEAIRDIDRNWEQADVNADARRMLKPEDPPMPPSPLVTQIPDFLYPPELEEFHFGPPVLRGHNSVQVPSWGSIFANTAASAVSMYANNYQGTSTQSYGPRDAGPGNY